MTNKNLGGIGDTDQRILKQKILTGALSAQRLQAYLDSLPDVSHNAQEVRVPWKARIRPAAAGGSGDVD